MKGAIGNIASTTSLGAYSYNASVSGLVAGVPATKPQAVSSASSYSYLYDCNGNAINRTVSGSGYTLTYDLENRLTGVSGAASATFVYDGDGNRVKATVADVTTVYLGNYYEWNGSAGVKYYSPGGERVLAGRGHDDGPALWTSRQPGDKQPMITIP